MVEASEGSIPPPREGKTWSAEIGEYWASIPFGLRLLLLAEATTLLGTVIFLGFAVWNGWPVLGPVTDLELLLLAVTIVVLTLLTEHSTRRSSSDVSRLIGTVTSTNRTLIEENRTHWSEQRKHLDDAIGALQDVARLEVDLIAAVKNLGEAQKAAIKLQTADLKAREAARQQEIEDQKPRLRVLIRGWQGRVIKHFVILARNDGPPGSDLDGSLSVDGTTRSDRASVISRGAPCDFDFGDIDLFPESGELTITCDVSSANKSHRYRFTAVYDYERNKGFWGSSPKVTRKSPATLDAEVLY